MSKKDYIIPSLALLCVIALLFVKPIPQDQNYHHFADQRMFFGIPNFLNVITNLPFAIFGLPGLWIVRDIKETKLKHISFTMFTGFLLLVTLGSGYYHLWPGNETLVYDRIPITIILMSFFSFLIYDLIDRKKGFNAFFILNTVGIMSVIYWKITEHANHGDLRWYGMVQFFPVIAIPLMLLLYKSSFDYHKQVIPIFIFFGVAKFAEMFDKEIYQMLHDTASGHSLKHLLMVAAEYGMVILISRRVKLSSELTQE